MRGDLSKGWVALRKEGCGGWGREGMAVRGVIEVAYGEIGDPDHD